MKDSIRRAVKACAGDRDPRPTGPLTLQLHKAAREGARPSDVCGKATASERAERDCWVYVDRRGRTRVPAPDALVGCQDPGPHAQRPRASRVCEDGRDSREGAVRVALRKNGDT